MTMTMTKREWQLIAQLEAALDELRYTQAAIVSRHIQLGVGSAGYRQRCGVWSQSLVCGHGVAELIELGYRVYTERDTDTVERIRRDSIRSRLRRAAVTRSRWYDEAEAWRAHGRVDPDEYCDTCDLALLDEEYVTGQRRCAACRASDGYDDEVMT